MIKHKISVIIPCYNVSKYIDRCMQSLVDQSFGINNMEVICVDDASTDDTVEKLLRWEKKYPDNIMIVESQSNGRQGAARNIGLGYSSADWVCFVDSDDWVEPDYLEIFYAHTGLDGIDMVCCDSGRDPHVDLCHFSESERETAKQPSFLVISDINQRKELIHYNKIAFTAYGKLINREFLLENDIFFPEGVVYEDIYWGSLINYYVKKVYFIGKRLYHYFVNGDSTVLNKGADYHVDMLTVNSMLWREVILRGFWDDYRDEIEFEFFYSNILAFTKIIVLRFETPPYSLYRLLNIMAVTHVPEYWKNPYYQSESLPEIHRLIIDGVYMGLDKESFVQWAENIKQIGL